MDYKLLAIAACLFVTLPNVCLAWSAGEERLLKNEGESVTLTCAFDKVGYDLFLSPIVWYKVVEGQRYQINDNAVIKSPFSTTGRFELDFNRTQTDWVSVNMVIKDLDLADDGDYLCDMSGNPPAVSHKLVIPVSVDSIRIVTNTTKYVTDENDTKKEYEFHTERANFLGCETEGGNPKPELKMYRGDEDITSEFVLSEVADRSGPKGLETVYYKLSLTNANFRPSDEQSDQELQCVARFPDLPALKATDQGTMDVKFPPKFDCERSHTLEVPVDIQNYVINCVIRGNPPVPEEDVLWSFEGGANATAPTNLTIGQIYDDYEVKAQVTDQGYLNVTLSIKNVSERHFNTYHLHAKNTINKENIQISLGLATTSTTTTTTRAPNLRPKPNKSVPQAGSSESGVDRLLSATLAHVMTLTLAGVALSHWTTERLR